MDDTPTKRYGPEVQGAGVHHNPTPGPAGQDYVYGHVWVTLARVVRHPRWNTIALPVRSELYVREKNLPGIPAEYGWEFRTKLQQAAQMIAWLKVWLAAGRKPIWLLMDGAYAKRPCCGRPHGPGCSWSAGCGTTRPLRSVPDPAGRPKKKRGRKPVYGDRRISLAKRAAARGGWTTEEVEVYGRREQKTYKTFLATWGPAGGVIRVVLVKQERNEWVAYFTTHTEATAAGIPGLVSDRAAIEQVFHDVKEVWGAGRQQLRNIHANIGSWHLNLWAHTLTELWA